MFEGTLRQLIEEVNAQAVQNRILKREQDTVGITDLLYCPLKAHYRKLYPDLKPDSAEVDDGFVFEHLLRKAAVTLWGNRVKPELPLPTVPYETKSGLKIQGHPDLVIIGKKAVLVIEAKSMNFLLHNLKTINGKFITGEDAYSTTIPEHYIEQAKLEKFFAEKTFNKPVTHYLFIKTLTRVNGSTKKVYVLRRTKENSTPKEIEKLAQDFLERKEPRQPWECRYCVYHSADVCPGIETEHAPVPTQASEEIRLALEELNTLRNREKELTNYLKRKLAGKQIQLGNKTIGWITKQTYQWNMERLKKKLGLKLLDYTWINWRKTKDLEKLLGDEVSAFREVVTRKVFEI